MVPCVTHIWKNQTRVHGENEFHMLRGTHAMRHTTCHSTCQKWILWWVRHGTSWRKFTLEVIPLILVRWIWGCIYLHHQSRSNGIQSTSDNHDSCYLVMLKILVYDARWPCFVTRVNAWWGLSLERERWIWTVRSGDDPHCRSSINGSIRLQTTLKYWCLEKLKDLIV